MADSPPDIEVLSLDDLQRLVLRQLEEIAALKSDLKACRERPTRRRRRELIRRFDDIFTARTGVAPRRRVLGSRAHPGP